MTKTPKPDKDANLFDSLRQDRNAKLDAYVEAYVREWLEARVGHRR
jgi:hypothetical protein